MTNQLTSKLEVVCQKILDGARNAEVYGNNVRTVTSELLDELRQALRYTPETCEQRIDLDVVMWAEVKEAIVKSPHFKEMFEAGGMLNDGVSSVVSMLLGPLPYVHLNKGGRDPDEKLYSALDVEAMLAVGSALHAHKANTMKAGEPR